MLDWKCLLLGRFHDAAEAARRAARLRPENLTTQLALGRALLLVQEGGAEGDGDEGFRDLLEVATDALELDHTSAAAHRLMAKVLVAKGELEKARGFFARAQYLLDAEVSKRRSDMNDAKGYDTRLAVALIGSVLVAFSSTGNTC